ncbi:MAG TPA: hypothetical protein VK821_02000 [Dehalococcoidia bacterium]|nr:hypothetical protein [Dehalococcoidia bacterium]
MGRRFGICAPALLATLAILVAQTKSARAGVVFPPGPNPPLSESNSCTNGQDLFQVATCVMTLSGNADGPVSDGTVIVQLIDPATSAYLSCVAAGCVLNNRGTSVNLYCGATAPGGLTPSVSCSSVTFSIASPLAACLANPPLCPRNANLNSSNAGVNVSFIATPGNGGGAGGGVLLSQDDIAFQGPNMGLLLVTASPQLIPSNGTLASVITATFACGQINAQLVPGTGFPLSSIGFARRGGPSGSRAVTNVPVLGTGQNAPCGAGLPGGFTFSAPRNLIFDNGRSVEGIGCGLGSNLSPFGGSSPIPPYHVTAPLIFTCTGAAVLAFGNGRPGDAPVNVVYTSSVGGLSAVGSTLLTMSPSSQPVVAISCNPQIISPGGPASICTASVADQNGIAMSGLNGVTITFTTSDTTNTVVLGCGYGVTGSINQTTTPNIAPQLSPQLPCQLPTNIIPSQVDTLLNGQATALVVAVPGAAPEVVTVSANLQFYLPPSTACVTAPYLPSYFNPATTGVGLPSVTGCGSANPVGFTGTSTALSTATAAVAASAITNFALAPSAGTTVTIGSASPIIVAGGTAASPLKMTKGCNQVVITSSQGTPMSVILGLIAPPDSVVSIWRFTNATKQYQAGLFADPQAPTEFSVTGAVVEAGVLSSPPPGNLSNLVTESYFVCLVRPAGIPSS